MEISRNVIQDLLPLYLSGEASADTVALVEKYLETDPGLAAEVKEMAKMDLSHVPVALNKENEMKAYQKAYLLNTLRTVLLTSIIVGAVLCILLIVPLVYKLFIS